MENITALLAPHTDAIKGDETGEIIAAILEQEVIPHLDHEDAEFLAEFWDAILMTL